jgi:hypothetical protein
MTVPSILSVSGSPVTTSGTLAVTLATQSANLVFAGPTTGVAATPTFRALVAADFPSNTIAYASLANGTALSVLGRSANSAGANASIAAGTDGHVLRRSGTTLGFGTVATGGIADGNVTLAKLANGTALSVLGRSANSAGAYADMAAGTDGHVLRRSGTTLGFGTLPIGSVAGTVPVAQGGTNLTSYAAGDLPYASGTTTIAKLPIGTTGRLLEVVSGVPAWAYPDMSSMTHQGCRLTHSADQSIANSTFVSLALDTETYDDGGYHDTVTNNTRITIPANRGGKYIVGGQARFASAGGNQRFIRVLKNGTSNVISNQNLIGSANVATINVCGIVALAVGDYVELQVFQDSGGAVNVTATADFSPTFWASYIGPADSTESGLGVA